MPQLGSEAAAAARLYERAIQLRATGAYEAAIPLLQEASSLAPGNIDIQAVLGETLGWAKRFKEAEQVYRAAIDRFGRERELQLGLARVILWQGRYREAAASFDLLLRQDARDANALEGRAQAAYWSGDFRRAERLFRRLIQVEPENAEALKALHEIHTTTRSLYRAAITGVDDSQPYSWSRPEVRVSMFSDPLTRWDIGAATYLLDRGADADTLMLGASTQIPDWRLGIDAGARLVDFPDGTTEVLGNLRLSRALTAHSRISVSWQETELLSTATSVDDHPFVSIAALRWEHSSSWSGAATARQHRYSDGNDGVSADIWLLLPLRRGPRWTLSAGPAVSYRDVEEPRFRFVSVSSELAADRYVYKYRGEYDPYWSPHDLREARVAVTSEVAAFRRARVKIQLDGGVARDRAVAFGPLDGPASVPDFVFDVRFEREYHPWHATVELTVPVREFDLSFAYRHHVTVFYRSDEVEAALVRRF